MNKVVFKVDFTVFRQSILSRDNYVFREHLRMKQEQIYIQQYLAFSLGYFTK